MDHERSSSYWLQKKVPVVLPETTIYFTRTRDSVFTDPCRLRTRVTTPSYTTTTGTEHESDGRSLEHIKSDVRPFMWFVGPTISHLVTLSPFPFDPNLYTPILHLNSMSFVIKYLKRNKTLRKNKRTNCYLVRLSYSMFWLSCTDYFLIPYPTSKSFSTTICVLDLFYEQP